MQKQGPKIVAELSGNHGGSIDRAMYLMSLAHEYGADLIKIQTYDEDSLTIDSKNSEFLIKEGLWKGYCLYDLYKEAKTPRTWMKTLFDYAKDNSIALFSSPFSFKDVDTLESVNCPIYKIASFEANYLDLIAYCAQTKKPLVISTGLASLSDVDRAYECAIKHGCSDITLLHCESKYPADPSLFNLNTIVFFKERYKCKVGLSNHSLGDSLDIAATALGADMIEKHFTDDRSKGGVDSAFSMDVDDLKTLVKDVTNVALSLGQKLLKDPDINDPSFKFRRSLYLTKDLKKGDILSKDDVSTIRPGFGLEPYKLDEILGKKAKDDIKAPIAINEKMFI